MTADPVLERVRAIVEQVSGPFRRPASVGADTPLLGDGYFLNSIDLLEVVVACEHEFGVALEPERELTAAALRTLGTLAHVIRAKISS